MRKFKGLEVGNKRFWKPILARLFRNQPIEGPVDPAGVRRILVLRLDRLGDMIVSTPLLRALKALLPHVTIDVFGGRKNIGVIEHDKPLVRQKAAIALGQIGGPEAFELLVAALKEGDGTTRVGAAIGLEHLGDPRAVEPLVGALEDSDDLVRELAAEALEALGWRPG